MRFPATLSRLLLPVAAAALLAGCAGIGPQQSSDPWEGLNRKTFAFNDALDKAVLKPVATGYQKVVPEFARHGKESVTVRHLLTHTSGLHDWEGDTAFSLRREYTPTEFIAFVAQRPLDFQPGSRFGYTNSAYPLIGMVVAKVSGIPYEQFVTEKILKPAGMTETRFRHASEVVPNRASGYADKNGVLINGEPLRPAILSPNGFILSTAADMAKWSIALTNGRVLRSTTMAVMTTPTRFNDGSTFKAGGIAWFFGEFQGHRLMVHNGATAAGFSSVIYRYPDDDLSVVVLMNIDRSDVVNKLATSIAGFYVPGLVAKPKKTGDIDVLLSFRPHVEDPLPPAVGVLPPHAHEMSAIR